MELAEREEARLSAAATAAGYLYASGKIRRRNSERIRVVQAPRKEEQAPKVTWKRYKLCKP